MTAQNDLSEIEARQARRGIVTTVTMPKSDLLALESAARGARMSRSAFVRRAVHSQIKEDAMLHDAAQAALRSTLRELPKQTAEQRKLLERAALLCTELVRVANRHRSGDIVLDRPSKRRFIERYADLAAILNACDPGIHDAHIGSLAEVACNWAKQFATEMGEEP